MSAETDAIVDKLANVGQARAALLACIDKLREGGALISQTDPIDTAAGVATSARNLLENTIAFAGRIADGFAGEADDAGLSELDRQKIRLCLDQAEQNVRLVAEQTRSPSYVTEFFDALNEVLASVAKRIVQAAAATWPVWTIVGIVLGAWLLFRTKVLA